MSTEHTMEEVTAATTEQKPTEETVANKGKGKAIQEHTEGEDDSSDEDDDMVEDVPEPDEEDLAEIDTSNIIFGGRTRGKNIDWTAAADEDAMDDEDEDDEEYSAPVDFDDDAMKE